MFANYLVAYIDILGFSSMVSADCESPPGESTFYEILYKTHQKAKRLSEYDKKIDIVQFSDSVVIATPYSVPDFPRFIKIIADYQYDLLLNAILSRGAVAYGKHFYENGFMFSMGLIEAYRIERDIAKYPRIVISNDLIEIAFNEGGLTDKTNLLKDNGEIVFLDFLDGKSIEELRKIAGRLNMVNNNEDSSVREKKRWLLNYISYKFPDLDYNRERFSTL